MTHDTPRIGLLGGTFDPIHHGHLRSAVELRERFHLDRLDLVPNHRPVHRDRPGATTAQRLDMLRLAIADVSVLGVDTREVERDAPSFTVETLRAVRHARPDACPVFFLGVDAFAEFDSWHCWQEILGLAQLVVVDRPGAQWSRFARELLAAHAPPRDHPGERLRPGIVQRVDVTQLDISATTIREHVNTGRDVRYLLPEPVRQYIVDHGLYRTRPGR